MLFRIILDLYTDKNIKEKIKSRLQNFQVT